MKINYGDQIEFWNGQFSLWYDLMYARVNLIFMFHYAVLIFCGGEKRLKMTAKDKGDLKRFPILMQHRITNSTETKWKTKEMRIESERIREASENEQKGE